MGNMAYDKKATRKFSLKLNLKTDDVIIRKLESVSNVQAYIKSLIMTDIGDVTYSVKPEAQDQWFGSETPSPIRFPEICRLSDEWEIPVSELMEDLIED